MTKYPYADKLARMKDELAELGLAPAFCKEYSGIITKEYVDKKLPTLLTSMLSMIDRGIYPSINCVAVSDVALLSMVMNRKISTYVTKLLETFEAEHGLVVAALETQIFLDTDKRFVNYKSIGDALKKIIHKENEVPTGDFSDIEDIKKKVVNRRILEDANELLREAETVIAKLGEIDAQG